MWYQKYEFLPFYTFRSRPSLTFLRNVKSNVSSGDISRKTEINEYVLNNRQLRKFHIRNSRKEDNWSQKSWEHLKGAKKASDNDFPYFLEGKHTSDQQFSAIWLRLYQEDIPPFIDSPYYYYTKEDYLCLNFVRILRERSDILDKTDSLFRYCSRHDFSHVISQFDNLWIVIIFFHIFSLSFFTFFKNFGIITFGQVATKL